MCATDNSYLYILYSLQLVCWYINWLRDCIVHWQRQRDNDNKNDIIYQTCDFRLEIVFHFFRFIILIK